MRDTAYTAGEDDGPASKVPEGSSCRRRGIGVGGSVLTVDSGSHVGPPHCWAGLGAPEAVVGSMTVTYLPGVGTYGNYIGVPNNIMVGGGNNNMAFEWMLTAGKAKQAEPLAINPSFTLN